MFSNNDNLKNTIKPDIFTALGIDKEIVKQLFNMANSTIDADLVPVQPMSQPSGEIFYLDFDKIAYTDPKKSNKK